MLVLLAALFVMLSLSGDPTRYMIRQGVSPATLTARFGFWGMATSTQSYTGLTVTWSWVWGAGWGWYLAVVGAIVLLVGGLITFAPPGRLR